MCLQNSQQTNTEEHISFPKIARLTRECVITEKIDGTNAQILIHEDGTYRVGSRNRWLSLEADNFGFARWVSQNIEELRKLGPGRHFGEWWGLGIQRGYGLFERRFSLFRVPKGMVELPKCVSIVPKLYEGPFDTATVEKLLSELVVSGSKAVPGYMKPEGIVIFHKAASVLFKKTVDGDAEGKGDKR